MITLSCTAKVRSRVKKVRPTTELKVEDSFNNWYVDEVTIYRKKYWMFTHSQSLFSVIIYVGTQKEIKNLETIFKDKVEEMIIRQISSVNTYFDQLGEGEIEFTFGKTNNRSVLGSMNDYKHHVRAYSTQRDLENNSQEEVINTMNQRMNEIPMGYIKYAYPKERMKELISGK